MNHIPAGQLNRLLSTISDPRQRKLVADIATGKVVKEVRCLSETCKGRIIGLIYNGGRVEEVRDKDGQIYLRASRKRFDGEYGFECWCGNDSRISRQEIGDLFDNGAPPSQEGIANIAKKLQADPANYPEVSGAKEVDGFLIQNVT